MSKYSLSVGKLDEEEVEEEELLPLPVSIVEVGRLGSEGAVATASTDGIVEGISLVIVWYFKGTLVSHLSKLEGEGKARHGLIISRSRKVTLHSF